MERDRGLGYIHRRKEMINHKRERIKRGYKLLKEGEKTLKEIGSETSISQGDLKAMRNDIILGNEER